MTQPAPAEESEPDEVERGITLGCLRGECPSVDCDSGCTCPCHQPAGEPDVPQLARELHTLIRNGKEFPYADAEEKRYYELCVTRWLEKIPTPDAVPGEPAPERED